MSKKYILEILAEYENKRKSAEEEALRRKQEVYTKIPRIKTIDSELASIGMDIAKSVLSRETDIEYLIEKLKKKSMDLKIEKAELLSKNNYPVDYAEPKYSCTDCQDTGYIGSLKCHCFKQKIIDKHYEQSNLKNVLFKENFDTFNFEYYSVHRFGDEPVSPRKNMEEIFTICINFVKNFDVSDENLFFYGNSGLGKTFLINCITKDLLDAGKVVIYQTAANLIKILKDAELNEDTESMKEKIDNITDCDLLIIDDLGTENITVYSQSQLYNILNERLLKNKKIIISTNFSLQNIYEAYAERITSRIFGNFTICKFFGDDIRVKIAEMNRRKRKR